MLIGSGLLAQAFAPPYYQNDLVCIFAAGVSNSACSDAYEFARERQRLSETLEHVKSLATFVYFGTCSINDPEAKDTPYVQHKLAMEGLVSKHSGHLILRLPQVAGRTPNPHTLLNFLYAYISRSESFSLWCNAKRNIIDVVDVVAIAKCLIEDKTVRNTTINIANAINHSMTNIVSVMEKAIGKRAIYNIVERGSEFSIDTSIILPLLDKAAVKFDDGYIERVLGNYYGKAS